MHSLVRIRVRNWMLRGDSWLRRVVDLAYRVLFQYEQREHRIRCGSANQHRTFFVIRSLSTDEGLVSIFHTVMRGVEYAVSRGYIPVIDFQNYDSQYSKGIRESRAVNAWEVFFVQPSGVSLEEVYRSANVILSGWRWWGNHKARNPNTLFYSGYDDRVNSLRHRFIVAHSGISDDVVHLKEEWRARIFRGKTLGVFLRGTDYVSLRPKGHAVQPSVDDVLSKSIEFAKKYDVDLVFLVTEDRSIVSRFEAVFGERLATITEDVIDNYQSGEYLSRVAPRGSAQDRGLVYLAKLLLLSECDYVVSSIANGSLFALAMKEGDYEDKHIFDCGLY